MIVTRVQDATGSHIESAWDYLNGVSTGATEARRLIREEQPGPA